MFLIYTVALGCISIKEIRHQQKMRKTIHVYLPKLSKPISIFDYIAETSDHPQELPLDQLNNNKYNVPLLTGYEIAVFGFVSFARILAFGISGAIYGDTDKFIPYQIFLLRI